MKTKIKEENKKITTKKNKTITKVKKTESKVKLNKLEKFIMLLQIIMVILLSGFGIVSIFYKPFEILFKILTGIVLLLIAYNNYKIYKRKYMTIIYMTIGIIILARTIFA